MPPPDKSRETDRAKRAKNRERRKAAQSDPLQTQTQSQKAAQAAEEALQRKVEKLCERASELLRKMQQFIDDTESKLQDPSMSIRVFETAALSEANGFIDAAEGVCAALRGFQRWNCAVFKAGECLLDETALCKILRKPSEPFTALANKSTEIEMLATRIKILTKCEGDDSSKETKESERACAEGMAWEKYYPGNPEWQFTEDDIKLLIENFASPYQVVQVHNACGGCKEFREWLMNTLKGVTEELVIKLHRICRATR